MDAKSMVKKCRQVVTNPRILWDAIEREYGVGCFNEIIMSNFGLEEDFEDKINKTLSTEYIELQNKSEQNLECLTT